MLGPGPILLLLFALFALPTTAETSSGLEAAAVSARLESTVVAPGERTRVVVTLEIPPPYHVNANPASLDYLIPTTVSFEPRPGARFGRPRYPAAKMLAVGGSPDPVAVYDGRIRILVPVEISSDAAPGRGRFRGTVNFQPCDDQACFAPRTLSFGAGVEIAVSPATEGGVPSSSETIVSAPIPASAAQPESITPRRNPPETSAAGETDRSLLAWILLAFLGGLALNLTPCVYPLIPVTVGYFASQAGSRARTFWLASLYVTALALVYAAIGTAAALTGGLFGNLLQNHYVLGGMAALMIGLALGMLGLYEVRLPASLNRFTDARPGAGGALAMGATMGLVAAPCIGPFVAALLAYVGARGDALVGFALFLSLGLGLGLPYLPLALVSDAFARWPRAGTLLILAKRLLGFALLGLALWFLVPILGLSLFRIGLEALAVGGGIALIAWPIEGETTAARRARGIVAVALILLPVILRVAQPPERKIEWKPYSPAILAEAAAAGKPVVVDVTASWCLPCQELDAITFSNPAVADALAEVVAVKADVTGPEIDAEVRRLLDEKSIRGVPTVLFIDATGRERTDLRLTGFELPSPFGVRLNALRAGASLPKS
jgi:thiol:disulfide interchange protein DsbD